MKKLSARVKADMIHDYVTTDMTYMDVAKRHGNIYSSSLSYGWLDDPQVAEYLQEKYGIDADEACQMWREKGKKAVSRNQRSFGRFSVQD